MMCLQCCTTQMRGTRTAPVCRRYFAVSIYKCFADEGLNFTARRIFYMPTIKTEIDACDEQEYALHVALSWCATLGTSSWHSGSLARHGTKGFFPPALSSQCLSRLASLSCANRPLPAKHGRPRLWIGRLPKYIYIYIMSRYF